MKVVIDIDDNELKKDMQDSELPAFDEWSEMVTKTIKDMCFPNINFQISFTHIYFCSKGGPYDQGV